MSKICIECNTTKTTKWYSGPTCRKCYGRSYAKQNKDYFAKRANRYRRTARGSYHVTKSNAKKRGIKWSLSFEEFELVRASGVCSYCKSDLPEVCGGLDRMDSSKGYHINNVVPCCKDCNTLKSHQLTHKEMISVVDLLLRMRSGKLWQS